MRVHALQLEPRYAGRALERLARALGGEPELRVRLAGRDLLVRLAAHVGRHTYEHGLRRAGVALGGELAQPLDLIEVVDHDQAHTDIERLRELFDRGFGGEHEAVLKAAVRFISRD